MPGHSVKTNAGTRRWRALSGRSVALEPQHGWAISERLHQISSATLQIRQGSLYPALHRLERRGWIKARWGTSDNNRRAKYYELTRKGRAQLEAETSAWRKLSAAIAQVLETASAED
jgi:PadR family transcriptional regulator PadR